MNANTRTPQQASIEAREAREAWERGEPIEFDYGSQGWLYWNPENALHPWFTSVEYKWRVATPTTTPVIGPGKWRTRDGLIVEIKPAAGQFPWMDVEQKNHWGTLGKYYHNGDDGVLNSMDLLTRVETKWRAFRPDEVPLGAWVRLKSNHSKRAMIAVIEPDFIGVGQKKVSYAQLFDEAELLNPDGTYSPCGVEEEVV